MKNMRVLLVEDNPGDAGLVRIAFGHAGYPASMVHHVSSLEKALQSLKEIDFNAILLDLALPDAQGLEALDIMRLSAPALPIVVLTGNHDEELGLRAIAAGAQNFLVKGTVSSQALTFALRQAAQQKIAEVNLQESTQRIQSILENMDEMYFSVDDSGGRPPLISPAAQTIMGRPLQHFVDDPWLWAKLVHKEDEANLMAILDRVHGGRDAQGEFRIVRADGTTRSLEASLRVIRGKGHHRIEGVLRDVTLQRAAAEQAHRLARLEDQERFRATFLNTAAHELGTPLTPIRIQVANLLRCQELQGEHRHQVELLHRNVNRLVRLVADFLDSARIQSGKLRHVPRAANLADIIRDAAESSRPQASEAGVTLAVEAPPDLPCQIDSDRISQVLSNLLHNALKFTARGGTVKVQGLQEAQHYVVRVQDTGPGLAPEQIALLFKPFSQLRSQSKVQSQGTGLGLFISQGIATQHGGRIECTSPGVGHGCTFTLRLPIQALPMTSLEHPKVAA